MRKSVKSIMFLIILVISLTIGCSRQAKKVSVEVSEKNVPYSKSDVVFYQEDLGKGTIVLYKDNTGFRHAFFSNKLKAWSVSGNADMSSKADVDWTMCNDVKTPIVTFAGIIRNNQIKRIVIKQKTSEKDVKIINVNQDLSVWFVDFDTLEYGVPDPLKIEGISDKGEILWKDGVY